MRKEIDLIPSELRAIETHKYYLSHREGREVSLEEAIVDFLMNYEEDFLSAKAREDMFNQCQEIERHKWIESERQGHDIGEDSAAKDWIEKYGSIWRNEQESLEKHGFVEASLVVERREGIRVPNDALAAAARRFDADIFLHKARMESYNFVLFGKKEYLNVKSILCPKFIEAAKGETIELIAAGGQAESALEAAKAILAGN